MKKIVLRLIIGVAAGSMVAGISAPLAASASVAAPPAAAVSVVKSSTSTISPDLWLELAELTLSTMYRMSQEVNPLKGATYQNFARWLRAAEAALAEEIAYVKLEIKKGALKGTNPFKPPSIAPPKSSGKCTAPPGFVCITSV